MAGETANIAEVANKVSKDIFKWFRWEKLAIMDENFPCHKIDAHKKKKTKNSDPSHTHPVDTVFKYFDPYLNKFIYLNTDLKSYSKTSIQPALIKTAIDSLAKTLDCAMSSLDWKRRYVLDDMPYEIRSLLFIYNWDKNFDSDLMGKLAKLKLSDIPLTTDAIIHVLDPERIAYLFSVVKDIHGLVVNKELPEVDYSFLYPDLDLHKAHGDESQYPATIEVLCSPYMIIKHGPVFNYQEVEGKILKEEVSQQGYVIYYNESGATDKEFVYLLDVLSKLQILSSQNSIKFRVANLSVHKDIRSNFERAKNVYVADWALDGHRKKDLDRIEFEIVSATAPNYSPGILAWRIDD
jgi:hypothetical protein